MRRLAAFEIYTLNCKVLACILSGRVYFVTQSEALQYKASGPAEDFCHVRDLSSQRYARRAEPQSVHHRRTARAALRAADQSFLPQRPIRQFRQARPDAVAG